MGQRLEEFRDRAEELVRDMLESGLESQDVKSILDGAYTSEVDEEVQ